MVQIYGTIGPGCESREMLESMLLAGMHGIRLNLSHASLLQSSPFIDRYAQACHALHRPVQLMIDLQGPEYRTGALRSPIDLKDGQKLILRSDSCPERDVPAVTVPLPILHALEVRDRILLQDGLIQLEVLDVSEARAKPSCAETGDSESSLRKVTCSVVRGGRLAGGQTLNIQGKDLYGPVLTQEDRVNLDHAGSLGVTDVMLPFVRGGDDVLTVRRALQERKMNARIFAKIECLDGIRNLDSIMESADVIVIARGDLGNAMPLWELPAAQKTISARCRAACKPFMVVTQMLHSMIHAPVPTRAEVLDIFNAVLDGADYLMVTGETSIGDYPQEVIRYLSRTAAEAEKYQSQSGMLI